MKLQFFKTFQLFMLLFIGTYITTLGSVVRAESARENFGHSESPFLKALARLPSAGGSWFRMPYSNGEGVPNWALAGHLTHLEVEGQVIELSSLASQIPCTFEVDGAWNDKRRWSYILLPHAPMEAFGTRHLEIFDEEVQARLRQHYSAGDRPFNFHLYPPNVHSLSWMVSPEFRQQTSKILELLVPLGFNSYAGAIAFRYNPLHSDNSLSIDDIQIEMDVEPPIIRVRSSRSSSSSTFTTISEMTVQTSAGQISSVHINTNWGDPGSFRPEDSQSFTCSFEYLGF